jgi:uncharacterized membrane protein YedE/YeeE
MEFSIHHQVLLLILIVALVLGAVMHATRFCTMGGVADWVSMGHKGRLGAWFFAMAVALGGVLVLEAMSIIALQNRTLQMFPPYRTAQFAWLRYLLGGLLFGIGMTLAGGCSSRTLVRVGGGSLKSLVVLVVLAVTAYFMLWTDFFQKAFMVWIAPTTVNLARWGIPSQELGQIVSSLIGANLRVMHLGLGAVVAAAILFMTLYWRDFRAQRRDVVAGAVVGLAIVCGWAITAGPLAEQWGEYALLASQPPIRIAAQSFTFVSPMGDTLNFLMNPRAALISFGVVALIGVVLGSLVYALVTRKFRLEWFASPADFANHVIGAVLMGIGGVLAMGCTIGQGITGVSTLALGSFLAVATMIFACAFTLKTQYHLVEGTGIARALCLAAGDIFRSKSRGS